MLDLKKNFNGEKILPENWLIFSVFAGAYYESDGYRDTWYEHVVIDQGGKEVCRIQDRESLVDVNGNTITPGKEFSISEKGIFYFNFSGTGEKKNPVYLLISSTPGIQKALSLASKAFFEKCDKGNEPYIYHLIRVMLQGKNEKEKIAGVLHDLIEDCDETYINEFYENFDPDIITAVKILTKTGGENYNDYLKGVKNNPIGKNVKIYDLLDNMNISRIKNPGEEDLKRLNKYEQAYHFLME